MNTQLAGYNGLESLAITLESKGGEIRRVESYLLDVITVNGAHLFIRENGNLSKYKKEKMYDVAISKIIESGGIDTKESELSESSLVALSNQ